CRHSCRQLPPSHSVASRPGPRGQAPGHAMRPRPCLVQLNRAERLAGLLDVGDCPGEQRQCPGSGGGRVRRCLTVLLMALPAVAPAGPVADDCLDLAASMTAPGQRRSALLGLALLVAMGSSVVVITAPPARPSRPARSQPETPLDP